MRIHLHLLCVKDDFSCAHDICRLSVSTASKPNRKPCFTQANHRPGRYSHPPPGFHYLTCGLEATEDTWESSEETSLVWASPTSMPWERGSVCSPLAQPLLPHPTSDLHNHTVPYFQNENTIRLFCKLSCHAKYETMVR